MRLLSKLAPIVVLVSCGAIGQESLQERAAKEAEFNARMDQLPIKPPTGKVSTGQLAAIFAKGCASFFSESDDSFDAALESIKKAGLSVESDYLSARLSSPRLGINGSVDYMTGSEGDVQRFAHCNVFADVSDPDADGVAALEAIMPNLDLGEDGRTIVLVGDTKFRVSVSGPELRWDNPGLERLAKNGGVSLSDLSDEQIWTGAVRVWSPTGYTISADVRSRNSASRAVDGLPVGIFFPSSASRVGANPPLPPKP